MNMITVHMDVMDLVLVINALEALNPDTEKVRKQRDTLVTWFMTATKKKETGKQ
jgi:hypothetical protein